MSDGRLHLFPDSNIFLEYEFFDQIDWKAVAGQDAALVVVMRPVINELDRHKSENKNPKKRERARTALRKFEEQEKGVGKLRSNTTFELWAENPRIAEGLDGGFADDLLIASVLHFASDRGVPVALVTGDLSLRLRARKFVTVLPLDESLLRPAEPDELLLRIKKLEQQVASEPQAELTVTFADGSTELSKRFFRGNFKTDKQIGEDVDEENDERRHTKQNPLSEHHEKAIRRTQRDFDRKDSMTMTVALLLSNVGKAPADDIHATVRIPERFELSSQHVNPSAEMRITFREQTEGDWKIAASTAVCQLPRIKQGMAKRLGPLYLTLRNPDDRDPFEISVTVNAATPPINETFLLPVTLTGH